MKNFIKQFKNLTLRQIFWENLGTRQTIAKNTFWLGLADVSINILKFLLLVYAARVLGDTGFGTFAFVSSFVAFFGIFFDLGLSEAITREFAKDLQNEINIAALFTLQVIVSLIAGFFLLCASFFILTKTGSMQLPILIMALYMFTVNLQTFFYAVFRARQKMQLEFFPNLLQNVVIAGSGFLLLYLLPTVTSLTLAYFVGAIFAFVPTFFYFRKYVGHIHFSFNTQIWRKFLQISYPLALVGAVSLAIYNNVDSIMLGFFGQFKENGWYSAAYRVVTFSIVPMSFISQSFFPALSGAFGESKEKLEELLNTEIQIMLFLGLPILFGGYILADSIISFLFPAEFDPAILVLKILIFVIFLIYLYNPLRQLLVVYNMQQKVFVVFFIGLLLNIIINLFTIPVFSLYGAAVSTLITQFFVLIGLIYLTLKKTPIRPINKKTLNVFINALLSSIVMYFMLHFLHKVLNVFVLISIGAVVYMAVFFTIHFLSKNEFIKKNI